MREREGGGKSWERRTFRTTGTKRRIGRKKIYIWKLKVTKVVFVPFNSYQCGVAFYLFLFFRIILGLSKLSILSLFIKSSFMKPPHFLNVILQIQIFILYIDTKKVHNIFIFNCDKFPFTILFWIDNNCLIGLVQLEFWGLRQKF